MKLLHGVVGEDFGTVGHREGGRHHDVEPQLAAVVAQLAAVGELADDEGSCFSILVRGGVNHAGNVADTLRGEHLHRHTVALDVEVDGEFVMLVFHIPLDERNQLVHAIRQHAELLFQAEAVAKVLYRTQYATLGVL